jgi:DNA-binding NarL/FixJ family response regulator
MTEPAGRPTRVLICDDQVLVRAGLVALIGSAPGLEVSGVAASGPAAVAQAAATRPDVVLIDARLPGPNSIATTRRILARGDPDRPRVLMLAAFDLDDCVYAALRAGASGFLLKDTAPEQLLAAVRRVAAGDLLFAPSVARRLVDAYLTSHDRVVDRPADLSSLTAREVEVLGLVAKGLSNREIAGRLVLSEATVKTHVNRVMTKLKLTSRAQAVVVAYETGLVVPG